jgi:hypothetical protein
MQLDKLLHKIQLQIQELAPTLEIFVEQSIQPTANDCVQLQKQLTDLQENIAVYKYDKLTREISPSFEIHSRISEQIEAINTEQKIQINQTTGKDIELNNTDEVKSEVIEFKEELRPQVELNNEDLIDTSINFIAPKIDISIGLNDKFRFINELFSQNSSEYNVAIEQLNNLRTWKDADIYLNSLKSLYAWNEESDAVKHFYSINKKKFN